MSDNCLHIVPIHRGDYPNAAEKRQAVLDWFTAQDMIEPVSSDCVLGDGPGYRFRPGIEAAFVPSPMGSWYSDSLSTFGLEVHAGDRRVFHPLEGAELTMTCSACGRVHDMDEATSFIPGWFDGSDDEPACLACGQRRHIAEWACAPEWGFSNFGITLWNSHWELTPTFLDGMRALLGTDVRIVLARL